jgi:hypothetical protein
VDGSLDVEAMAKHTALPACFGGDLLAAAIDPSHTPLITGGEELRSNVTLLRT